MNFLLPTLSTLLLFLFFPTLLTSTETGEKTITPSNPSPQKTYLKDYQPPHFSIPSIHLTFELDDLLTKVDSTLEVKREKTGEPLLLNGEEISLIALSINGQPLTERDYTLANDLLTIHTLPENDSFTLRIQTTFNPTANKELSGLYKSGVLLSTQCESQGFRRITFFPDRPDVMSKYRVTIIADKKAYPTLLSNGNEVARRELPAGKHLVEYVDPFPKPCYLFALVAGDLALIEDSFTTKSGKKVALQTYVDKGNENRTGHAIDTLKRAMRWDEEVYGLEYDLDNLKMVAVRDFNFGAMENKGLLIFNDSCVLGNPDTATDRDLQWIEAVVAHEYFHNWTGNRITLRDWFQLALKEGLTEFRNQSFSGDMNSQAVTRINDVRALRMRQFPEDNGPLAHPVLPKEFVTPDDSYTMTTYNKGAEIYNMLRTLLGKKTFHKGMDRYFELNDGKAVTIQHVLQAMQDVTDRDLSQFALWFNQAGTPTVDVTMDYNPKKKEATLTITQSCRPTRECQEKKPFLFPFAVGLLDKEGNDLILTREGSKGKTTDILWISKKSESFTYHNIPTAPIPSLLRNFCAPVKVNYPYTPEELTFLLAHDSDAFNRYDAGQRIASLQINAAIEQQRKNEPLPLTYSQAAVDAFGKALFDKNLDEGFRAELLTLPSLNEIIEEMEEIDFQAAFLARKGLKEAISNSFENQLLTLEESLTKKGSSSINYEAMGRRSLKHVALSYLSEIDSGKYTPLIAERFEEATNMTDRLSALKILANRSGKERTTALKSFYNKWKKDPIVMNHWFAIQAGSEREEVLEDIQELLQEEIFDKTNPNNLRSLLAVFSRNLVKFHDAEGKGYHFLTEQIEAIDKYNKSISSRLMQAFEHFSRLHPNQKSKMEKELNRLNSATISKEVRGNVSKILGNGAA